jgi:hypothetical protein
MREIRELILSMKNGWYMASLAAGSAFTVFACKTVAEAGNKSLALLVVLPIGMTFTLFAGIWTYNAPKCRAKKLWSGVKYPKGYHRWGQARLIQPEGYVMVHDLWKGTQRYPCFDVQVMVDGKVCRTAVEAIENNNDPRLGWWRDGSGEGHRGLVQVMVKEGSRALQEGEYPICMGK